MIKAAFSILAFIILLSRPAVSQDFRSETSFPEPLKQVPLFDTAEYDPFIQSIIDQTDLDSLISYIRILSGEDSVWIDGLKVRIRHRISSQGNDLAADFIKKQLQSLNLQVYEQVYSSSGRNIYAVQPGMVFTEKPYIICAHYDAVDDYCADDNASGVAAVLEAARILSQFEFQSSLIYALWDEEETGFWGSQAYVSQAYSDQMDIQGVINIDMIGWDGNDDQLMDIHTRDIANSNSLANTLFMVDSLYELPLEPAIYNPGTWQSDHSVFWDHGYGAILMIEAYYGGDLNPYYHSSADRLNYFDLDYFHNLSRLAIGSIATLAGSADDTLITTVIPDKAYQNSILEVKIQGFNTSFAGGAGVLDVWLSKDTETILADSVIVQNDTSLTAFFSIPLTATPGFWEVNVETSIDGILTKTDGFEIIPLPKLINVPDDYHSIQEAIDLANDGDTVLVQPGTYVENINFNGKNILVGSLLLTTGDRSYITETVIDGDQNGSVVTFEMGEDTTATLSGFTITNGGGESYGQAHGPGIFLDNGSSPNLLNLIVSGNKGNDANGAGICCWSNNNCRIENVLVQGNDGSGEGNSTNDGSAGILLADSSPIMKNVTIVDNVGIMAGGLFCNGFSNPVLINVTIANNSAHGGDVWSEAAEVVIWGIGNPVFINTIIWNDSLQGILQREASALTVAYSNIQGGRESISKFLSDTTYWLDGNINADPKFVHTAGGDYRLREGSPCIDKGIQDTYLVFNGGLDTVFIPAMDYTGPAPDIGAFEHGDPLAVENKTIPLPDRYTLHQNYPNPFNPATTIEFTLPRAAYTTLKVYNILGAEVATLVSGKLQAGLHKYPFDGSNLASGVYLYRLQAGEFTEIKKLVLLK